jgi:hypothetical protein
MHFTFRKAGLLVSVGALVLCCSCEKHQLGEMPSAQKEHVDIAKGSSGDSDVVNERSTSSPTPSAKSTPAEFFPENTPSP